MENRPCSEFLLLVTACLMLSLFSMVSFGECLSVLKALLSASLYVSKRGAY